MSLANEIKMNSDKFMRKDQNYLLKSDFKIKTLRKLSTPKLLNMTNNLQNTTEMSQIKGSFLNKTQRNSGRNEKKLKEHSEITKKFEDFYKICDHEDLFERTQTTNIMQKIGYFKKEIRDLTNSAYNRKEENEFDERFEGNFQNFKNQTKFKKKMIDLLLNPIKNKQDLLFVYNKNQAIKNYLKKFVDKKEGKNFK